MPRDLFFTSSLSNLLVLENYFCLNCFFSSIMCNKARKMISGCRSPSVRNISSHQTQHKQLPPISTHHLLSPSYHFLTFKISCTLKQKIIISLNPLLTLFLAQREKPCHFQQRSYTVTSKGVLLAGVPELGFQLRRL